LNLCGVVYNCTHFKHNPSGSDIQRIKNDALVVW
jgi:hypothetical protein